MFSTLFIKNTSQKESDPFQLPIEYLEDKFILNETVAYDLELSVADSSANTIYHYLMNPKTPFENNIIPKWKKYYTTNTDFLEDTQSVIKDIDKCIINDFYKPSHEQIMQIWSDTKEDSIFLERYSFMEFEILKWVNKSPSFLQAISIVNMGSPILSFLIPFIMFLLPFLIVKMQGHNITFSIYLQVLKEISKNHFIGKILQSTHDISLQNLLYIVLLIGLYLYQIYQNYIACIRFYSNISKINEQICEMQKYLDHSIKTMSAFRTIIETKKSYQPFLLKHNEMTSRLVQLRTILSEIRPFTPSFSKIGEIGDLLGCYYEIYSNNDFGEALLYSFSFEGYVNNLLGIYENIESKNVGLAIYKDISGNPLIIKDQYYPALLNETFVTNDATLDKNMVITGPNAAGKTTFLKTTMLNVIFSQQFGCGFYSSANIVPYTYIHSYLNIPDTSGRDSLFQAESRRCKEIIDDVLLDMNNRHFCIFDELYSGTNPIEAAKSAFSFLKWLSERSNVDFILTTHYVDICSRFKKSNARITNWKMDATEKDGDIEYSYKIVRGVSKIQGAIKVLKDMDYPSEIIESIKDYSINKENI